MIFLRIKRIICDRTLARVCIFTKFEVQGNRKWMIQNKTTHMHSHLILRSRHVHASEVSIGTFTPRFFLRPFRTGIPENPPTVAIELHDNSWQFPPNSRPEWSQRTRGISLIAFPHQGARPTQRPMPVLSIQWSRVLDDRKHATTISRNLEKSCKIRCLPD